MFSSSSWNIFPRPRRWFTIWVNLVWSSETVSPFFIQKTSYSDTKVVFLAFLTFVVPSWVTSSIFHISFAFFHLVVRKNSSKDKPKVKIFLAFWSFCTFLFSSFFISSHSLGTNSPFTSLFGINGPLTIGFHALDQLNE